MYYVYNVCPQKRNAPEHLAIVEHPMSSLLSLSTLKTTTLSKASLEQTTLTITKD